MIKDAYIQITDASNTELVSFKMDEYYSNVTSMMIGEIYQHNGIWKFNAIGNGVSRDLADSVNYTEFRLFKRRTIMLTFETINELTLKVTCTGNDVLFVKAGAFIAGDNSGPKNYRFEKVLLGPQQNLGQALFGQLARRVTGENLPLMKVNLNGDSVTYYANYGQHVVIYQLAQAKLFLLNLRTFWHLLRTVIIASALSCRVLSQKGLATSTLTARGKNAYVAVLSDGNQSY